MPAASRHCQDARQCTGALLMGQGTRLNGRTPQCRDAFNASENGGLGQYWWYRAQQGTLARSAAQHSVVRAEWGRWKTAGKR